MVPETKNYKGKKLGRGKLQKFMEKMHLPMSLDSQKGIERDEHFRAGGTYKKYMSIDSARVNMNHVKAN